MELSQTLKKLKAVQDFPIPENQKISSFLGLAGYYRRFIKNFTKIAQLLTQLLKQNITFKFDDNCMKVFQKLKDTFTIYLLLQYNFGLGKLLSKGTIGKD